MVSCKVREKPEFLYVKNIKVVDFSKKFVTLNADVYFKNPNVIGGQLQTNGIRVLVDDKQMAEVSASSFDVPARKEFSIPLVARIETDSIIRKSNLGTLVSSLLNKKINVRFEGLITYKILGYKDTYRIDETETIKLKF